jgi:hypothetical protein
MAGGTAIRSHGLSLKALLAVHDRERRKACPISSNGSYLRYGSSVIASGARGRHLAREDSVA